MKKKWFGWMAAVLISLPLYGCSMQQTSQVYLTEGNGLLEEKDYQSAAEAFEQAIEAKESAVLAWRGIGMACMGLGQYEMAESAFEQALSETDKKMPETVLDLELYLVSTRYRLGEYEKALQLCNEILEKEENDPPSDVWFIRGACYLKQGDKEAAAKDFDQAVLLDSRDFTLYLTIYECYEENNLSGIGNTYLQEALDLAGDTMEEKYQRGRIYYYLKDYDSAYRELTEPAAAEYEPAMNLLGEVYLKQQDYAHAEFLYDQISQKYGETTGTCNARALCQMEQGNYEEARSWIEKGVSLDQTEGKEELYYNEIVLYERCGDYETAMQKAKEYVQKYPGEEKGQKELAFLSTR